MIIVTASLLHVDVKLRENKIWKTNIDKKTKNKTKKKIKQWKQNKSLDLENSTHIKEVVEDE